MVKQIAFRIKLNNYAFIAFCLFSSYLAIGQNKDEQTEKKTGVEWSKMSKNKNASFYDVQQNFNKNWTGKKVTKGSGFKPFKRWEDFMAPRVYPSGDMTLPYTNYENYTSWLNENKTAKTNKTAKSTNLGSWVSIGPVGKPNAPTGQEYRTGTGRVNFTRVHPNNSLKIYVGTPNGGLWITTDGGATWNTNTDFLGVIGCSDIVFDPINPDIMYLATGDLEGDKRSIGVLKSIDGGNSWNATSLVWSAVDNWKISKLLINPNNGLQMIVAVDGGVFKTTDGWVTNTQIPSFSAALTDMELKPGDPNTVYASGTQLWKSTNFGDTWTEITSVLPTSNVSRIALAVTPANSNYVYAVYGKADNQSFLGFYRSTDSGDTFTEMYTGPLNLLGYEENGLDLGTGQAFFDLAIAANPANAENVTLATINQWQTSDGGTSWNIITHWTGDNSRPTVHSDFHDVTYDPANNPTFYSGSDGGIFKTTDNGVTWTDISNNLNISQVNKLGISQTDATLINAGMQDNGTNLKNGSGWNSVFGGDGGESFIDWSNNNTIYFCYVESELHRSDDGGLTSIQITNGLPNGGGLADFYSSFHQDPVTSTTLYAGGHIELYKTIDKGANWTMLGTPSGTKNITEFAIAPSNNQIIYAVKENAVSKSIDGGVTFTNVTGSIPTTGGAFTMVTVKNNDALIAWVTKSGYSDGNKVFKTIDGGVTWTNISAGLPNLPVNTIVSVNGSSSDAIYIGADIGVYYLDNTLSSFNTFMSGLPNTTVKDLEIYYPTGVIRAATYGRGIWESSAYTLGVQENIVDAEDAKIKVYPNPVSNELTIELENNDKVIQFDIININGKVVYSGNMQHKTTIETTSFAAGLYIIKLENNKTFEFKKIVKK